MKRFFGKYRGKVVNNVDPEMRGRLQISAPAVLGPTLASWAMPCVAYGGPGVGFVAIPPIGANLWVEFEEGDPDYPIWTGCFWGLGEAPQPAAPNHFTLQTPCGMRAILTDTPGAVSLTAMLGASSVNLFFDASGFTISTGVKASVRLTPASVSINNGALEVI